MDGVARHMLDLSAGLDACGWEVTIATRCPDWFRERIASPAIHIVDLPMAREIQPLVDTWSFVRLARLCRQVRPTVIHLHSSKAGFLGRVAGRLMGVPIVVYTPHCWSFQSVPGWKRRFYVMLERFASRFCDMTVAVSTREVDEALALRVLRPERIRVIHNGVPPFASTSTLPPSVNDLVAGTRKLIVSAGKLSEPKAYHHLVEAMEFVLAQEPDARLVVAGDGPLAGNLRSQVEAQGLTGEVHFVGELDGVAPLLDRASLFVLSSLWEGLPYVILEAMSAALPVVTTDVGGCPELVIDSKTGLIVPPAQPRKLADAILSVLRDSDRGASMGAAGRDRALKEFGMDRWLDENEAVYTELLGQKGIECEGSGDTTKPGREEEDLATVATPCNDAEVNDMRHTTPARLATVLTSVVVVMAIVCASLVDQAVFADRILPGVHIGPIDVGWMTRDEANARLVRRLSATRSITLEWPGGKRTIRVVGTTLGIDPELAASQAFVTGRTGSLPVRLATRWQAMRSGITTDMQPKPTAALRQMLVDIDRTAARQATNARFELVDGTLRVVPSATGIAIEQRDSATAIADAFLAGKARARLPVANTEPEVTTFKARLLAHDAARWVSAPMRLTLGRHTQTLRLSQILAMIVVRGNKLAIGKPVLAKTVAPLARSVIRRPTNARPEVVGHRVVITGGRVGRTVNVAAVATRLPAVLVSKSRTLAVPMLSISPLVTRSDLATLGIRKLLSTFTTTFRLGKDRRDVNIGLSARAVRGRILGPGEVFSLNEATGPRNRHTGYRESLVFANGKVVPGIGGGVCQVSSTLYEAALLADLRIVDRSSHSMAVSYLPPGRDATTFYPTVDLKFQNNRSSAVLLWSTVRGNRLTMQVYGSGTRPKVVIRTIVRKTMPPRQRTLYDRSLPEGDRVVEIEGQPGYVVTSYRLVFQGNDLVRREFLATDEYRPRNKVVRVGIQ